MSTDPIAHALAAAAALADAGRVAAAERLLLEVLARAPHEPEALHRLGVLVGRSGRIDRAIDLLRRAVAAAPADAVAHYHLGVAVSQKGNLPAAAESFAQAIALRPDLAEPHANLAMTWLLAGDYDRGLPEYEWRAGVAGFVRPPPIDRPMWDGTSSLAGRTLLLRAEQGFGDTIQFSRYAGRIRDRFGGRLVLEVQPALRRLLDGYPGTDAVVSVGEATDADVWLSLLSSPRVMDTRLATIPGPTAVRPPSSVRRVPDGGRRLGLVWAGSPTNTNDGNRSLPVGRLAPLTAVPGIRWFGLQLGRPCPAGVTDLMPGVRDFADTAALVAQLDGIVTVDTAVAHLAGSMDKPTWLMLPLLPDWRWGLGRADTPWYPSVRLFRQPAYAAWEPVVAAVARAIA